MTRFIVDQIIGSGQIATTAIPSAALVGPGTQYWDTTIGSAGKLMISDGTAYSAMTPIIVAGQSGIPVILPSSGTLSAAGALSAIVALPQIYANCWMFFPANAVATVSAAGMYFVQMTSTTAGTVFQNTLTSGIPTIPAASALIPCTTASSYTQTSGSNVQVLSIPVAANALGPNGRVEIYTLAENDLAAGTKSGSTNFGGGLSTATFSQTTTNIATPSLRSIFNKGVTGAQVAMSGTGLAAAAGAAAVGVLDTTGAINVQFFLQIQNAATNTCQYSAFYVNVIQGS